MTNSALSGILNIDKPPGMTSRDVVNVVQRLVRPAKAGHAGTLDPLATGVLVVAVGAATRLIEYVQQAPKRYRANFLLGRSSDTEDITGEVVKLPNASRPTFAEIEATLPRFTGPIAQRPPAFSALKVQGQRAYDLARQGAEVHLAERPIVVYSLRIVAYEWPELIVDVECGSGTYVRSLGRDLAESLGTGAVMSALVREAVGRFTRTDAVSLDELTAESLPEKLQSTTMAVAHLPSIGLGPIEIARIRNGLTIPRRDSDVHRGKPSSPGDEIVALNEAGALVSILALRGESEWTPLKNFAS